MAALNGDDFDEFSRKELPSVVSTVARIERSAAPHTSNHDELAAAVDELPPQQRAAVALYCLEDRPTVEVAALLSCSKATVRSHLHRARRRLADALGEARQEEVGDVRG